MDFSLYRAVNGLSGRALPDHLLKLAALDLPAVLMVVVALTFLVGWTARRTARRSGAVLAVAAAARPCGTPWDRVVAAVR